jgi:HK97 family phage major capsid protein
MDIEQLREQHRDLCAEEEEIITTAERRDAERDECDVITEEMPPIGCFTQAEAERLALVRREADEIEADVHIWKKILERRNAGAPGSGRPSDARPFTRLGEQLLAVVKAGRVLKCGAGELVDPRLAMVAASYDQSGLGESVPSDGGFLLQRQFDHEILKRSYDTSEILSRVRRLPIGGRFNGIRVNAIDETSRVDGGRWGGVFGYWAGEGDAMTASKPKFRQIEMKLQKLTGLVYVTDELLKDVDALETLVMDALPEELRFRAEDAILEGSGAGQPQGILNSPAKITIAAEGGQPAGTIVWENIQNMWARTWVPSARNAVWLINQDCTPQLATLNLRQAGDTRGTPVFLPAGAGPFGGGAGTPLASLLGRPVIPVEYCSTLGTEGDIVLCDLNQYVLIDKSLEEASSIHVEFLTDQMVLRFIYRVNGRPAWSQPLIPFKGANTLSPFITLATRS